MATKAAAEPPHSKALRAPPSPYNPLEIMLKRLLLTVALLAGATVLVIAALRIARQPSNDRPWVPPQKVLPRVVTRGDIVEIRNLRDFTWHSANRFEAGYVDRTYDLRKLDSVWYAVSRFGGVPGLAHAFLSFGFGDEYISISVEARREEGETYSPMRGLLQQYELMYVLGTERDVLGLRTNIWKEAVTLYPIRTTPGKMRRAFIDMTSRAEELALQPEFYDTLTSSCSSNIIRHVNTITPGQVRFGISTVLPGFSDRLAFDLGMIDSDLPFERIRTAYRVDAAAQRVPLDENFSGAIRRGLPPRTQATTVN